MYYALSITTDARYLTHTPIQPSSARNRWDFSPKMFEAHLMISAREEMFLRSLNFTSRAHDSIHTIILPMLTAVGEPKLLLQKNSVVSLMLLSLICCIAIVDCNHPCLYWEMSLAMALRSFASRMSVLVPCLSCTYPTTTSYVVLAWRQPSSSLEYVDPMMKVRRVQILTIQKGFYPNWKSIGESKN